MDEKALAHYGTPRHSGRYPWGSGGDESSRNRDFLGWVESLKAKGLTEKEIMDSVGMKSTEFRARKSIALNERRAENYATALKLKNKGMSNTAIAERMGTSESNVRAWLKAAEADKPNILKNTVDALRAEADKNLAIDVGSGVEHYVGVTRTMLDTAIKYLENEGYNIFYVKVQQLGTRFNTNVKVLAKPGTRFPDVAKNPEKISLINTYSKDGGRTMITTQPPLNISSTRIKVAYANEGGADNDGVIFVRPGVKDLSLGHSRYAQVRVAVDGTHYLKGMAIYKDDLPKGVDIVYNSNKSDTGNKKDAMKPLEKVPGTEDVDWSNPFGTNIRRQITKTNEDGSVTVTSAMNILNEEGKWGEWNAGLSSQMLSKQAPKFAKQQLDMLYERKKNELDEINSLTNPVIKRKLLEAHSDSIDSVANKLEAAGVARTAQKVILPITSLKDNQVYAPTFKDGERVVLIRHPHGGPFEIPELTVNNRNPEAKKLLGDVPDAIGINPNVAQKLSGADFDGDTVLIIPNAKGEIRSAPSLQKLKDFDPKTQYKGYPGMKVLEGDAMQQQMGRVSNLITDMTIKRASQDEIARAVRHSMVVIDAEKHKLDWKRSEVENGIVALKKKYQGVSSTGQPKGASTLISKAGSEIRVPERVQNREFIIDPKTGRKIPNETGNTYLDKKTGKLVIRTQLSTKLAETQDAHTLSSGTHIEKIYADHANRMKALANEARRSMVNTKNIPYNQTANKVYAQEVSELVSALNIAQKNAPRERQAQLVGNAIVSAALKANPNMDKDDVKDLKVRSLDNARAALGVKKEVIKITPRQWEAIQAGAVSNNRLTQIIDNADLEVVKNYATPRTKILMTSTKVSRAKAMLAQGYTQAEVASQLGVSLTTLKNSLV
jgi:DNA-binding NarL/FixJ family response regulator